MKKFFAEFKAFIKKGNVVDLAVAVIIGAAFNKIVSSLVNDIIMPLVSLCVGGADVTDWKWIIREAEYDVNGNVLVAESALKYGVFIQAIIDFLIIALTVFIIVKVIKSSSEKITKVSQTIINETKELTKKQIKAFKKLQKRANKKGKTVEQLIEEENLTNPIAEVKAEAVAEVETTKDDAKPKDETPKQEEASINASEVEQAVDNNEEILLVLKEIRDSLKADKKQ